MKNKFFRCLTVCAFLLAIGLSGFSQTITGTTTVTVTAGVVNPPLGNESLLPGQTPASCVSDGCGVAGWHTAIKQDFEGGLGPYEELSGGISISTVQNHSGSHALQEVISFFPPGSGLNSPGGKWIFYASRIPGGCCAGGEYYASWYSYLDPGASSDLDGVFAGIGGGPGWQQGELMDVQNYTGMPTTNNPWLWFSPQTNIMPAVDCNDPGQDINDSPLPQNCGFTGVRYPYNLGTWRQEEMYYKESTCTGGVPNNDSDLKFFINGSLAIEVNAANSASYGYKYAGGNANGCLDMNINPTWSIPDIFSFGNGNPTAFNKYVDDIIILKR